MLKVFLVEDEFIVREGIKRNIDWEGNGYQFAGEASDGELALPMIQKEKPDIVITDIKMPFMDGLTLARLIKESMPNTEIVLLTGHEEFEYAKEALKIGVAEYLTKPISGKKLLEAIDGIAGRIRDKQEEAKLKHLYFQDQEEVLKEKRRNFLMDIVTGDKSTVELLDRAKKLNIRITAVWYSVLLFGMRIENRGVDLYSNRVLRYGETLKSLADREQALFFDRKLEGYCILFKGDSEEAVCERSQRFIQAADELLSKDPEMVYFGGLGKPVNRLREVGESFSQASKAYANRYFLKLNQVITCDMQDQIEHEKLNDLKVSDINMSQFKREQIREYLRGGEAEEVEFFITDFFLNIGKNSLESKLFRQYVVMDVYFCVCEFMEEIGQSKEKVKTFDMTDMMTDKEKMRVYIKTILSEAIDIRDDYSSDRHADVVDMVKRYIQENYARDDLSLNEIAARVNFSPNHLSMVFSQKTGEPLIKYITAVRMEKAKELLKCTNMKSSQIAYEVGYKDAHYFSYLFKKTQGMTPTQFR